jgi:molybdate transport system substrate-binding protein
VIHSLATSAGSIFFCASMVFFGPAASARQAELVLLSGAGLRQPVETLLAAFTRKTGIRVVVSYGGSGQQMVRYLASGLGDVFIPGSLFYIKQLVAKGKIKYYRPTVFHLPVIAINRKSRFRVKSLKDMAQPGLRLGLGDPKSMALGRTAEEILTKSGLKKAVAKNVVVRAATVKQLALYVAKGFVDVAVISRADAFQNQKRVLMVPIPRQYYTADVVGAGVFLTTTQPARAKRLADWLSSPRAVAVFAKFGFTPLDKHRR